MHWLREQCAPVDGLDAQRLCWWLFMRTAPCCTERRQRRRTRQLRFWRRHPRQRVRTGNGAALLLRKWPDQHGGAAGRGELTVGYSGSVLSASQIIRAKNDGFYLLTDSTVERFNNVGEFQWSQPLSARPRALIAGRRRSWCSAATRCSHRRSRQLPADSDLWVRRSCGNSTLRGK